MPDSGTQPGHGDRDDDVHDRQPDRHQAGKDGAADREPEPPHPAAEHGDEDRGRVDGLRHEVQDRSGPDGDRQRAVREDERHERQREQRGTQGEPAQAVALRDRPAAVAPLGVRRRDQPCDDDRDERRYEGLLDPEGLEGEEGDDERRPDDDTPASPAERVVAHEPRHDGEQRQRPRYPRGALEHVDDLGDRESREALGQHRVREADRREPATDRREREDPPHGVGAPREDERRHGAVDGRHGDVHDEEPQGLVDRGAGEDGEGDGEHGAAPGGHGDRRGRPGQSDSRDGQLLGHGVGTIAPPHVRAPGFRPGSARRGPREPDPAP